jgi:hypothetical protein
MAASVEKATPRYLFRNSSCTGCTRYFRGCGVLLCRMRKSRTLAINCDPACSEIRRSTLRTKRYAQQRKLRLCLGNSRCQSRSRYDRTPTFRSYRKVDFHRFSIKILIKCLLRSVFQRPFLAAGVVAGALVSFCLSALS